MKRALGRVSPPKRRRTARRRLPAAIWAALLAFLAGCATLPPPTPAPRPQPPAAAAPVPPPESPTPGPQVGTTASGGTITIHQAPAAAPAAVDSTPSEDALAVLSTIPDPLGGGGASDTVGVPVPAPTQPLGDRSVPRATAAPPESLTARVSPPPTAPVSAPGTAPASGGRGTVRADSCWRVQVAAPPERERAERMVDAARSQLLVPFVIEQEGGLFKVRSRDCLSAAAANDVRRRAAESGFAGAFRFHAKPR